MIWELTRQKQIIEKTVRKVREGIGSGVWKFSLKTSDNIGSGDINEVYVIDGKASSGEYDEVNLRFESKRSLVNCEDPASRSWCFSSNLKQLPQEDPFVFKGGLDGVAMQYGDYYPEEKEILELVKDSIVVLEEAQTSYDLQDIDNAGE